MTKPYLTLMAHSGYTRVMVTSNLSLFWSTDKHYPVSLVDYVTHRDFTVENKQMRIVDEILDELIAEEKSDPQDRIMRLPFERN